MMESSTRTAWLVMYVTVFDGPVPTHTYALKGENLYQLGELLGRVTKITTMPGGYTFEYIPPRTPKPKP